jgi:hypothetical protein
LIKNLKKKKKTMDFKERNPVKSESEINNNIMGQINTLFYLGWYISYKYKIHRRTDHEDPDGE